MARTVRNPKLDTRSARAKLPVRKAPYWTPITPGCALGYRKGAKGSAWIAKIVRDGLRRETRIGPSDDVLDPDNAAALSFAQAQEHARRWFSEVAKNAADETQGEGSRRRREGYTVTHAAEDYMAWFRLHRKSVVATQSAINAFIMPELGKIEVAKLSAARIRQWHHGMAQAQPRVRSRRGSKPQFRDVSHDPEAARRRQATANRVLTVLKAALNHAHQEGLAAKDDAWRRVKPFRGVDAPRVRYLNGDECTRLVNACDPDFRRLVQAALLTGCRYGELAAMRCGDFNPDAGAVSVRTSKSGRPRHAPLSHEGIAFFERVIAGRHGDSFMFLRRDGKPWGASHQRRRLEVAAKAAGVADVSFHILRHTYGSALAMKGVPLGVIAAALGHADTRMTERHYAALAPSYVAETIRANLPPLGIVEDTNVKLLKLKKA